jgi:hypothetical protein
MPRKKPNESEQAARDLDAQNKAAESAVATPEPEASEAAPVDPNAKPPDRKTLSTSEEMLSCTLTDEEFNMRAKSLARTCGDIAAESERAEKIKTELKAHMASLVSERERLALIVDRRSEIRGVIVEEQADFKVGIAEKFRKDTGEKINERPLATHERQRHMDELAKFDKKQKAEKGDARAE